MARKQKKPPAEGDPAWLITFSDLVTLLLTFFVLLLSMSSMDRAVLIKVTNFKDDLGVMSYKSAGMIPERLRLVIELLENPWDVLEKQNRIKDLLFPDDILPKDISRATLNENLEVLKRPEGVALVLTDALLFGRSQATLTDAARVLLNEVAQVLGYMTVDVNVSGHTDAEGGGEGGDYALSAARALAVLNAFTQMGMDQRRFTVSAYGPYQPLETGDTPEAHRRNRRVEILLKTQRQLGDYS
ncbi:MAG: flagellar motor protein MotB [Desulfovibrionaceae bacterium]|jgi:chemotaxis protein MotB|nr:flagellar motor protein MotB [Desulfovibrionaceae bacterium]